MARFQGLDALGARGVAAVEDHSDVVLHADGALVLLLQVVQLVDQHLLVLTQLRTATGRRLLFRTGDGNIDLANVDPV